MKKRRWIILPAVILSALCLLVGCKSKNKENAKADDVVNQQPSKEETVLPSDELDADKVETDEALPEEKSDTSGKPQKPSGSGIMSGSTAPNSSEGGSQSPTGDGTQHPSSGEGGAGETQNPPAVGEPSAREPILLPEIELD